VSAAARNGYECCTACLWNGFFFVLLNEEFVYLFNDSRYAKALRISRCRFGGSRSLFVKNLLIDEPSELISIIRSC
jgi:hypothetical protein